VLAVGLVEAAVLGVVEQVDRPVDLLGVEEALERVELGRIGDLDGDGEEPVGAGLGGLRGQLPHQGELVAARGAPGRPQDDEVDVGVEGERPRTYALAVELAERGEREAEGARRSGLRRLEERRRGVDLGPHVPLDGEALDRHQPPTGERALHRQALDRPERPGLPIAEPTRSVRSRVGLEGQHPGAASGRRAVVGSSRET